MRRRGVSMLLCGASLMALSLCLMLQNVLSSLVGGDDLTSLKKHGPRNGRSIDQPPDVIAPGVTPAMYSLPVDSSAIWHSVVPEAK